VSRQHWKGFHTREHQVYQEPKHSHISRWRSSHIKPNWLIQWILWGI